ncbi:MAG: hypothetical protein ACK587_11095, partial [Cyanobacteriota bacterium]
MLPLASAWPLPPVAGRPPPLALAAGRAHARAPLLAARPFGLMWGPLLGGQGIALATLAFLV